MGYERYMQNTDQRGDYDARTDIDDRYRARSSAREYRAAGQYDDRSMSSGYGRDSSDQRSGYGYGSGYGPYGQRGDNYGSRTSNQGQTGYGRDYDTQESRGYGGYGRNDAAQSAGRYGGYGQSAGDQGSRRYGSDTSRRGGQSRGSQSAPDDYDYEDRGFFSRAGDEVRSWFGDEEAERRRAMDERIDAERYRSDPEYHGWRQRQIASLDRDYDDYRTEKQQHFHQQFSSWREQRNAQRQSLQNVKEHMDVVGSDGDHVGTVDKVQGDRIVLTKNDADAGGHHHSIPVGWIESVNDKVTLNLAADEAQRRWKDEERNQAMFGDRQSPYEARYGMMSVYRTSGY